MLTAAKIHGFIFIALVILVLIDLYTYNGIRASLRKFSPRVKQISFWIYWLGNGTFILSVVVTSFAFNEMGGFHGLWYRVLAGTLFLLYVPKIFYLPFLLIEDVYRLVRILPAAIYKAVRKDKAAAVELFEGRRRFISNVGLFVASVPFTGIIYGVTKGKYNFKIHKADISFKDLPKEFDGLRITQISDIHSGSFSDREPIQHAVDLANQQGSDIIFFTGDLVNNRSDEMEPWIDIFKQLKAPMGVYSILGNHDYGDYVSWPSPEAKQANMEKLYDIHKQLGFKLMRNENTRIERKGAFIDLVGIENWGKGGFTKYGDFNKAVQGITPGSFKILLSHDPSQWDEQVINHPEKVHLTLSGHTHGAQFGVEMPGIKFSPIQFRYKHWAGLYAENERYIYVNRGLGFIGFPGRVGIWPEITVLTLHSA